MPVDMIISVTYMSGAGNLFTVVNNKDYHLSPNDFSKNAPILCGRENDKDLKTDGLLILEENSTDDFDVQFFNPDGTSDVMCGNGGRCIVAYAAKHIDALSNRNSVQFQMAGNKYHADLLTNSIKLFLPKPTETKTDIEIEINNKKCNLGYCFSGTEHVVINYNKLNIDDGFFEFDINRIALRIRHHEAFQPKGVNVNFYTQIGDNIYIRTFEKGVEGETGACGTGSIATAFIINKLEGRDFPIKLIPKSNKLLTIDLSGAEVILEGPAEFIGVNNIKIGK